MSAHPKSSPGTSGGGAPRKEKDPSYRHVFKGRVLVNTLLDYDASRFANRDAAVKFAQKLLDLGQVESIVGKRAFEDGMALYRWCDESVVREAKKMAHTTTTTHIPKKRLIELLDLQHGEGSGEAVTVDKAREAFTHVAAASQKPTGSKENLHRPTRSPAASRAANTAAGSQGSAKGMQGSAAARSNSTGNLHTERKTSTTRQPRDMSKNRAQTRDSSRNRTQTRDSSSNRTQTRDSSTNRTPATKNARSASIGAQNRAPTATQRRQRAATANIGAAKANSNNNNVSAPGSTRGRTRTSITRTPPGGAKTNHTTATPSPVTHVKGHTTAATPSPVANRRGHTSGAAASPATNRRGHTLATASSPVTHARNRTPHSAPGSGLGSRSDNEKSEMLQEAGHRGRGTPDLVRCPDSSMRVRSAAEPEAIAAKVDTSIERHVTSVLESREAAALAVPDGYDEFGHENDVFHSPVNSSHLPPSLTTNTSLAIGTPTSQASPRSDLDAMTSGDDASLTGVTGDLATLTAENSGFSDNEKQLLSQMSRIKEEHKKTISRYEEQITQLMKQVSELRAIVAERKTKESEPVPAPALDTLAKPATEHAVVTPGTTDTATPAAPTPPPAPPPPSGPPPPPPPPLPDSLTGAPVKTQAVVLPTKSTVMPRVKMRPLFWSRILLGQHCTEDDEPTFWHDAEESSFDIVEFENLFGKDPSKENTKIKSLHETIAAKKEKAPKQQNVKLLDENRSRAVVFKLRSLHCDMKDIRNAVYKMKFGKLDVESLHGLYEIKGSDEEIAKITSYVHEKPGVSLDQPEQFLLELNRMPQFSERIECLIFRKTFNETLFNIDQQFDIVDQACRTIKRSQAIENVLEHVLAFGNYMNGGTQRGQADGFDLEVLAKLKDVKSMDNSTTLLKYLVHIQCVEEHDAGKQEAECRLPDTASFTQAAAVSFKEVSSELNQLKTQLKLHSRKADIVCLHSDGSDLHPFKEQMEDFFESADNMLKGQIEKLDATKEVYDNLLKYLTVKDSATTPEAFFGLWVTFLDDYKALWKAEQKCIAKNMFNSVQDRRRKRQLMRRQSVVEDSGKTGKLKEKFNNMRRRPVTDSSGNTPGKLFRSQSVCAVNSGENALDNEVVHSATEPRRRRSRLDHTQSMDTAASMSSIVTEVNMDNSYRNHGNHRNDVTMDRSPVSRSRSAVVLQRGESSESISDRMRQRLRGGDSSQSLQNTPENTPARARLPSTNTRIASDSGASPNESMKQRMDRRRRERQGIVSDSSPTPQSPKANMSHSSKPSIDLATLRQKFAGSDSSSKSVSSTAPSTPEPRTPISRRASQSNIDHRNTRLASTTSSLARSSRLSGSQDALNSPNLTRAQRRESWRGSHSSLATGDSGSSKHSRTGGGTRDWRGSHSNLNDIGVSPSATTSKRTPKEREPISFRTPASKSSASADGDSHTRSAPPSRVKQEHSTTRKTSSTSREQMSWRGSNSNLADSGSKRRESWRGSHQNLSSSSDVHDNSLRSRKRESWRGSHSNLSSSADSNYNTGMSQSDTGSARIRAKEAWRSSQTNLNDVKDATNSPALRRTRSRTSLTHDSGSSVNSPVQRSNSVNVSSTNSPALRRSRSRTSVNEDTPPEQNLRRTNSRQAINDSHVNEPRGSRSRDHASTNHTASSTVSSLIVPDKSLSANESDAMSERDYRERLRKLSRTRSQLLDNR